MINAIVAGAAGRMGQRIVDMIHQNPETALAGAFELPGHSSVGKDAGLVAGVGDLGVTAGVVSAIGAVSNPTLGFFDPETKTYIKESFHGSYEVASLNGTAGIFEGKPILHVHVVLADREHKTVAGHLFSATVSVTLEAHVSPLPGVLERKRDDTTSLNLLHLP